MPNSLDDAFSRLPPDRQARIRTRELELLAEEGGSLDDNPGLFVCRDHPGAYHHPEPEND